MIRHENRFSTDLVYRQWIVVLKAPGCPNLIPALFTQSISFYSRFLTGAEVQPGVQTLDRQGMALYLDLSGQTQNEH